MNRTWLIIVVAVLMLAAAAGGWWIGHQGVPAAEADTATKSTPHDEEDAHTDTLAEPLAKITTVAVKVGLLTQRLVAYGTVQVPSESQRDAIATLDGRIVQVLAHVGQQVAAGTPLAELAPSAELALQADEAQRQAVAADEDAALVEQRHALHLATNQEAAVARHAATLARFHSEALAKKIAPSALVVTAPLAGWVIAIPIHVGQSVSAGATLATLASPEHLEVRLGLDPAEAPLVSATQEMVLSNDHVGVAPWSARIRTLSTHVDPVTHLVDAMVSLAPDVGLRLGEIVRGECMLTLASGLIVPRTALRREDGTTVVFRIVDGKAVRHLVTVLAENDELAAVTGAGLVADVLVANSGVRALSDGQPVTISVTGSVTGSVAESGKESISAPAMEK